MKINIRSILIIAFLMLSIDGIYLTFIGKPFFQKLVQNVQHSSLKVNLSAALFTYFLLILALYYFIISQNKTPFDAFILGFCIYGVFDFTNIAIFKNYDFKTGMIDTLWGGILFYIITFLFQKI